MTKIYFINLDRATDRLKFMTDQFAALGIAAERVAAVDAKTITTAYLEENVHPDCAWLAEKDSTIQVMNGQGIVYAPLLTRYLTAGEIGCYLSHARTLSHFLESGEDCACILEDDARLSPDLPDVLAALGTRIGHAIVKLEGVQRHSIDLRWPVAKAGQRSVMFRFKPTAGSAGYFVTRSSARALLDSMFPIREPYDGWFRQYWRHGISVYEVSPFPVEQEMSFVTALPNRINQPNAIIKAKFRPVLGAIKFAFKTLRVIRRGIFFATMAVANTGLRRG